uniref:WAP domain-containing protein n=1 Tax=Magallana gigas TaxID=29159 RepID=A0A8W8IN98_MAGGI
MRMIFGVSEPAVFLLVLFGWAGLGEAGHYKKAGECPVASPYMAGVCSYDCSYDAECEDDKKCCSTGCGMVCQSPVFKDALSKGAECPKVSYRKDTYGNTWPMTSFIYCDTGCCGSRDNQDCCDEDKDNRYNRKNVMVGINAGTHYQMQPQIAQYSYPTAPPLYEQAVATGGQTRNSNITHSRSNGKLF